MMLNSASISSLPRASLTHCRSLLAAKPAFQFGYFPQSPAMALFAGKACCHECAHKIEHQLRSDDASAQAEDIHVVVLHSLVRGVDVVAHSGANFRKLVCRDGNAHAAAADQECALAAAAGHFFGDGSGIVGIIVRFRRVMSAKIYNLVPEPAEFGNGRFVQRRAGVICSHSNAHVYLLISERASLATRSAVNPKCLSNSLMGADAPKS